MIAAPLLAFTGAVIGPQLQFQIGTGWCERPVLWIALVAATGAGKSPAIRAAREPLDLLQHDLYEDWRHQLRTWAQNPDSTIPEPAQEPDRLATTDPTMTALIDHFAHQRGVVLIRDELFGIIRSLNRYGGDQRQKYLSLWSSEPIAPMRKGENTVFVRNPVACVVGGLQPLLVHKFRSQERDGLIERFLPVFTVARQRYWSETVISRTTPPDATPVRDILAQLRTIEQAAGEPDGLVIARTPQAGALWSHWYNDNVDRSAEASPALEGFYAKLPAHVARLALVLHAIWHPGSLASPVSAETLQHAIDLGEFFRIHIHRTLLMLNETGSPPIAKPNLRQRTLRVLAETSTDDGWLTRTELRDRLQKPSATELEVVITDLIEGHEIESGSRRAAGSRKAHTVYRLVR
jgi:hypothetical protein